MFLDGIGHIAKNTPCLPAGRFRVLMMAFITSFANDVIHHIVPCTRSVDRCRTHSDMQKRPFGLVMQYHSIV